MTEGNINGDELQQSFIRLLIGDVLASRERLSVADTQRHRREVVRSTFAAIEGMVWIYREHVREVARNVSVLTPIADLALQERSFTVSEQGNVIEQVRFVTLPTIVRLATKQARLIDEGVSVDFSETGWSELKAAIDIRNRVTHPKSQSDLQVSLGELGSVAKGFAWLLGTTGSVMATINLSFSQHIDDLRKITDALNEGDERTIADYRAAIMRDENE